MKDLTVLEFCRKFGACREGRKWAYSLFPERSKASMSRIREKLIEKPEYGIWTLTREGVLSDKDLRLAAIRFIKETVISNGKFIFDLLTDQRSLKALEITEKYACGLVIKEELLAAHSAACAAADAAADAACAVYFATDAVYFAANASACAAAYFAAHSAACAATYFAAEAAAAAKELHIKILMSYGNPFLGDNHE